MWVPFAGKGRQFGARHFACKILISDKCKQVRASGRDDRLGRFRRGAFDYFQSFSGERVRHQLSLQRVVFHQKRDKIRHDGFHSLAHDNPMNAALFCASSNSDGARR
jgi:hypothetical protein